MSTVAGSPASLECRVEASPRSVNYWVKALLHLSQCLLATSLNICSEAISSDRFSVSQLGRDSQLAVNPGGRFSVVELDENSYSQRMLLTLETVRPRDFGSYACVARNSLVEVRSEVQLHVLTYHGCTAP